MPIDSQTRQESLERSLLELGCELFRLKTEMRSLVGQQQNIVDSLFSLKSLLDEKGLISTDDFEEAIDVARIQKEMNSYLDLSFEEPSGAGNSLQKKISN